MCMEKGNTRISAAYQSNTIPIQCHAFDATDGARTGQRSRQISAAYKSNIVLTRRGLMEYQNTDRTRTDRHN